MKISLRAITIEDEQFLFAVYTSTRVDELALVDWNAAQKDAFLQMQFRAQQGQYRFTYPNATTQIIESDGVPAGRLIVDRSGAETLLVDIASCRSIAIWDWEPPFSATCRRKAKK